MTPKTCYLRAAILCAAFSLTGSGLLGQTTLPGTTLFFDDFEDLTEGEEPSGNAKPGLYPGDPANAITTTIAAAGYTNGPQDAVSGSQFLEFDRAGRGGPSGGKEMVFEFDVEPFPLDAWGAVHFRYYVWMDPGFVSFNNWFLTTSRAGGLNQGNSVIWAGIGGRETDGVFPRDFYQFTTETGETYSPTGDDWQDSQWNKVHYTYSRVTGKMTVRLNDGAATEVPIDGDTSAVLVNMVRMRAGIGTSSYFVDDVELSVVPGITCRENPELPGDLSGDIVFSHNFEADTDIPGEAPGTPEVGSYAGESNGTVATGSYVDGDLVGPPVANTGSNYLVLSANQSLGAVFQGDPFAAGDFRTVKARFFVWLEGDVNFGLANGEDFTHSSIEDPVDGGSGNDKDYGNWNGVDWEYYDIGNDYIPGQPEVCMGWNEVEINFNSASAVASGRVNGGTPIELSLLGDSVESVLGKLFIEAGDSSIIFLDDIQVAVTPHPPPGRPGTLPGTMLFYDDFDSLAEGEEPSGDAIVGFYPADPANAITTTIAAAGYTNGPQEAVSGNQFLEFDRAGRGGPPGGKEMVFEFDVEPFTLDSWGAVHVRFYLWMDSGFVSFNNWWLTTAATGGLNEGSTVVVAGIGGRETDGVFPRDFYESTTETGETYSPTGNNWLDSQWNKLDYTYTRGSGKMFVRLNDGPPFQVTEVPLDGDPSEVLVSLVRMRAGNGTSSYFVDNVEVSVEERDPLPGTRLFYDDFENLTAGEEPSGDAFIGFYPAEPENAIENTSVAAAPFTNGPQEAFSGVQFLEFDRALRGGERPTDTPWREMVYQFEVEPFTLDSAMSVHFRYYVWMDPGFVSFATWGLTTESTGGLNDDNRVVWTGIGGRETDGVFRRDFYQFANDVENYSPTGDDWQDSMWNKLEYIYTEATGKMSVSLNDGEPTEVPLAGDPSAVLLNMIRMRAGNGTTSYFVDDVELSVVAQPPSVDPWPAGPIFQDGFENSVVEAEPIPPGENDPDLGTYGVSGIFVAVLDGFDPENDDSPETSQAGANHLGIDDRSGGFGDPLVSAIFECETGSGRSPANINQLQVSFWIWIAAAADNMATFAIGSSGSVRPELQLVNAAIGGEDLAISYWDGAEYIAMEATVPDREWAKITLNWDGAVMMVMVNDVAPAVELGLFGRPETSIDRIIFGRADDAQNTIYYLDSINTESLNVGPLEVNLSIAIADGDVTISWDAAADLLLFSSDTVDGEYTDAGLEITEVDGTASVTFTPDADTSQLFQVGTP